MLLKVTLLLLLALTANARNTFMVTAPKMIHLGGNYTVNINILNAKDTVDVHASIIRSQYIDRRYVKEPIVTGYGVFEQGKPGRLTLNVPRVPDVGSFLLKVKGSRGLIFEREQHLYRGSKSMSILIQTDKAMYKPGQKVLFRAFGIYPNLKIYQGPLDVTIFDPHRNRIHEWKSITNQTGVIEGEFQLSEQSMLGKWSIAVSTPEITHRKEYQYFSVKHYELPKFEVTVNLPPFALTSDENLSGTISANYTYGKGVKGLVEMRAFVGNMFGSCGTFARSVHKAFEIDGSVEFSVSMADLKRIRYSLNYQTVTVVAIVTEELTGKTLNGSSRVKYYTHPYTISFLESSPNTFKPGLPFRAFVKVAQQDGRPVTDTGVGLKLYPCVEYEIKTKDRSRYACGTFSGTYGLPVREFKIPNDGVIPVDMQIPDNVTVVRMKVYYKDVSASKTVYKSQSPSDTYIQVRITDLDLKPGDTTDVVIRGTGNLQTVFYQITSKGIMVINTGFAWQKHKFLPNTVTFNLEITAAMSPSALLLVYYVKSDGEVVADSISFKVEEPFENKVSIGFSAEEAEPNSDVWVNVNADVNSTAYMLAVDQSVLLLKSGNDITKEKVTKELNTYGRSYRSSTYYSWRYPRPATGQNAYQIFQNAEVVVIGDVEVYRGVRRSYYRPSYSYSRYPGAPYATTIPARPMYYSAMSMERNVVAAAPEQLEEVERVRTMFPETWIWTSTKISSASGQSLTVTVPDTITSWQLSAFAVNKKSGLGVASTPAKLTVFRAFFVSVILPQSVVKDEVVIIKAIVSNYLEYDRKVLVTLKSNRGFMTDASTGNQTVHVRSGEVGSVHFKITPKVIGMVDIEISARTADAADAVRRQLPVKPEGIRKEENTPVLIHLTRGQGRFRKNLRFSPPQGLVKGSESIALSVTGDVLGSTMENLADLLILPSGCGEQTLLKFTPNTHIANYLTTTNQMTPQLAAKIKAHLKIGYQRLLSYQRRDRSFSAFGEGDEAGSVFLTAAIAKAFSQAQRYTFIDINVIDAAVYWLMTKQKTDGAFVEPGRVIDRQLQGRKGDSPALTAIVLLALADISGLNGSRVNANRLQQSIQKGVAYLERLDLKGLNTYNLAIVTFALSRANSVMSDKAFALLLGRSKTKYNMMYWDVNVGNNRVESIDVMTTAYALMTFVTKKNFTGGMPVLTWLASQKSRRGGFISSQVTTVALEALSKFVGGVQPDNYRMAVTVYVYTRGYPRRTITKTITKDNALVLHTTDLALLPNSILIQAQGEGMAVVELKRIFNVISKEDANVFDIKTVLLDDDVSDFTVMTCTRHLVGGSSGMCVVSVQIPSGFTPDMSSAGNIAGLKRLEQKDRTVVAYFDQIGTSSTCFSLSCSRTSMVIENKESFVSVVDYYKPDDCGLTSYLPRALEHADTCDVCQDCAQCG